MKRRLSPQERGRQLRDVGIYTAIPMMLIAGPALGYFLGSLAAGRWGHTPAFEAGGAMLGLAAAARQIWLLLSRR
ncbi:MAG: hypothetical protein Q7W56_02125 [Candidatus Latescibacteria bacterium]|nr:hypothetical protein [Candidatus Latescibacterota bacterium]